MDSFNCKHFSLGLPKGKDQSDITLLLHHVANELKNRNITILDIMYEKQVDDNGDPWPYFTVYYTEPAA